MLQRFSQMGHKVIGCGRRLNNDLKQQLSAEFPHANFAKVNIADASAVDRWAGALFKEGHTPDIVLCNSGVCEANGALW
jgi:NADP-dependent 3-hydroxy acid dehydrogenase YdfG